MEAFLASVQQDVLRFDVGVDDAAALVEEVQPRQHLGEQAAGHLSDARVPTVPPQPQRSTRAQRECKLWTFWC